MVDHLDTFSRVIKLTSVCLLISLVASHNWPLHQLDIKNLKKKVYIEVCCSKGSVGRSVV